MTLITALVFLSFGFGFLLMALVGRNFYSSNSGKTIPRWVGRLLFALVGLIFFTVGLRYFLRGQ